MAPKAAKKAASHPKYEVMVCQAIKDLKERNGSSVIAINKYIKSNYGIDNDQTLKVQLRLALKRGVEKGQLKKVRASYKLTDAGKAVIAPKKAKKPDAKKATGTKKAGAKKASGTKKAGAKKASGTKKAGAKKASGTKKAGAKKASGTKKAGAKKASGTKRAGAKKASGTKRAGTKKASGAKKAGAKKGARK